MVLNLKQFIGFYILPVFTETTFQKLIQQNISGMVEALLSVVETGCRS